MSMLMCAASTMSVALLYCMWRESQQRTENREKQLRERVTYMLWVMANTVK